MLKPGRFDPQTQSKSIPIPKLKSRHVRSLTLKSSQYRPPRQNQVNLDAHTKTKRFAARIQKPRQFRPRQPTQEPSQSIITLKTSQFRLAHGQFRSPAQKTSQFRYQH